jgi:integrase
MKAAGIYPVAGGGFRAVACIGRGKAKRVEKRFPKGTALRTIIRWQEDTRRELREQPAVQPGSLAADVAVYLPIKQATMPPNGYKDRTRLMGMWLASLGPHRHRSEIQPVEIRAALAKWEIAGWAKGSSNRARTALMDFYNVMGGKSAHNPVRDVKRHPEFRRPAPAIDYATLHMILALMPDRGQGIPGETRRHVSQTKARLSVIAYTGLPHAQIMRLQPEHIDWAARVIYIPGRRKGEGQADSLLPISRSGLFALIDFADVDAWGPFSQSSMRISFQRAAAKVGRGDLTPYDLRHLYGTTMLDVTRNRAAVSLLMLHSSEEMTKRYTRGAELELMRSALDAFDRDVVGPRALSPSLQKSSDGLSITVDTHT